MSDSAYIHGFSEEEQNRLSTLNTLLNAACLREMKVMPGDHILDVGSGLGQFSRMMAHECGPIGRVLGIERSSHQIEKAKRIAEKDQESFLTEFRKGDAYKFPLSSNEWSSFDITHARFVLEHVQHPEKVISQMLKATKPGGRVIISDDDHSALTITPEDVKIERLWKAYYRTFEKLENDPYIGRKLVSYLYSFGLDKIRNTMIFFGSCADQPDFKSFVYNFKQVIIEAEKIILSNALMTKLEFDEGMFAFEKWENKPDAAIWYSLCWAEGTKPSQKYSLGYFY